MKENKQIKADLMLLFVSLSWGLSYIAIDVALMELSPFLLNSIRFLGSFLLGCLVFFKRMRNTNIKTLKYSLALGTILFIVYVTCTYGIKYTSLSNAGFLCALSVITTPIIAYIFKGVKQDKKFILALVMSVVGMALLMLNGSFTVATGDILCILTAIAYGFHLNITETAVGNQDVDSLQIGVFQLGVTGAYCLIFSIFTDGLTLPTSHNVIFAIFFLTVICTGCAFIVQSVAQKYTTASHVGVIFALEPVFAGVVAYFFKGEILSLQQYIGGILLIMSVFVMEFKFGNIFKRRFNGNR